VRICDTANVVKNVKPKTKPKAGCRSATVTQILAFHQTISAKGDSGQLSQLKALFITHHFHIANVLSFT